MASARMFEFMVMWQAIFIPLVIAFGANVGAISLGDVIAAPQNVLLSPFLDFQSLLRSVGFTGIASCGWLDANCNAGNIAQATLLGLTIIGYGSLLMFQVLQKIGAGIVIIFAFTNFFGNGFGIPFLGQFEIGFLVLMIIFGLALIKPGGHGTS